MGGSAMKHCGGVILTCSDKYTDKRSLVFVSTPTSNATSNLVVVLIEPLSTG